MNDFDKQLESFNDLLKTDIDKCRKKTEELGNESKKRLSSKSGFDKDTPQRRVDCYFRKMIEVTGHGFGKSMIRERDGKDASSDDIIKTNPDKEVEISGIINGGQSGGRIKASDGIVASLENIYHEPKGKEALEFKKKTDTFKKVFPTTITPLKNPDNIREKLISQLEGDKDIKGIRFREIEFKIKRAIEFNYTSEKNEIENIISQEKVFGIRDDKAPEASHYTYYNEFLDGFISSKEFDLNETITEINSYKKETLKENSGEDLKDTDFNESSDIYKQLFCFAWNKAKIIANNGSSLKGGQSPDEVGKYTGRKKPNLLVLSFGIIMIVFSTILVYQTWRNLYNTFEEIYYAGASQDIYDGLSDPEAEATFTITTFFSFFKQYFLGTLGNNLLALEDKMKDKAQQIYSSTLDKARETSNDIWNRGWAVGISETITGYAYSQISDRTSTQAIRDARREFDRTIENTQDQFKGYAAALGSVYLCSWIAINMFATGPIIVLNQCFPNLVSADMVYRSVSGLITATSSSGITVSSYNMLGVVTCLGATADNYRTLFRAVRYIRNPRQRQYDLRPTMGSTSETEEPVPIFENNSNNESNVQQIEDNEEIKKRNDAAEGLLGLNNSRKEKGGRKNKSKKNKSKKRRNSRKK